MDYNALEQKEVCVMSDDRFFDTMLYFFPDTKQDYVDSIERYGERLNTVVIEDIFMPRLIELLKQNKDIERLHSIFDFFEEVSNCDNQVIRNAFEVTVLEVLDIDKNILAIARQYMGLKTAELQSKICYNI